MDVLEYVRKKFPNNEVTYRYSVNEDRLFIWIHGDTGTAVLSVSGYEEFNVEETGYTLLDKRIRSAFYKMATKE